MFIAPSASVSHLCNMLCLPFFSFFFFFYPISVWLRLHTAGFRSNTDLKKYIPGAHVNSFIKQSACRCLSYSNSSSMDEGNVNECVQICALWHGNYRPSKQTPSESRGRHKHELFLHSVRLGFALSRAQLFIQRWQSH